MQFNGKTVPAKAFSGLHQCIGVTSEFSGGKFEQTLNLIRRRNPKKKSVKYNPQNYCRRL